MATVKTKKTATKKPTTKKTTTKKSVAKKGAAKKTTKAVSKVMKKPRKKSVKTATAPQVHPLAPSAKEIPVVAAVVDSSGVVTISHTDGSDSL